MKSQGTECYNRQPTQQCNHWMWHLHKIFLAFTLYCGDSTDAANQVASRRNKEDDAASVLSSQVTLCPPKDLNLRYFYIMKKITFPLDQKLFF